MPPAKTVLRSTGRGDKKAEWVREYNPQDQSGRCPDSSPLGIAHGAPRWACESASAALGKLRSLSDGVPPWLTSVFRNSRAVTQAFGLPRLSHVWICPPGQDAPGLPGHFGHGGFCRDQTRVVFSDVKLPGKPPVTWRPRAPFARPPTAPKLAPIHRSTRKVSAGSENSEFGHAGTQSRQAPAGGGARPPAAAHSCQNDAT